MAEVRQGTVDRRVEEGHEPPWELRIHGVAGTPASSLLDLRPLPPPGTAAGTKVPSVAVYRMPDAVSGRRALTWSSLTSGGWWHSLYILLAPFMLSNLAGWTLPAGQRSSRRFRLRLLVVRLLGVVVTMIAVTLLYGGAVDIVARRVLAGTRTSELVAFGAVMATWLVAFAVSWLTRIRPNPRATDAGTRVDLAGIATLGNDQAAMWRSPQVATTLHRAHSAVLHGMIAVFGAWSACAEGCSPSSVTDSRVAWTAPAAGLLGIGCLAIGIGVVWAMSTSHDGRVGVLDALGDGAWRWLPRVGLVSSLLAAWTWSSIGPGLAIDERPPGLLLALTVEAAAVLVLAVALVALGAWVAAATATLAAVSGAVFGAGLGAVLGGIADTTALTDAAGSSRSTGVLPASFAWLAFTTSLLVLLVVALALLAVILARRKVHVLDDGGDLMRIVRRVVQPPDRLVTWLGAASFLATAVVALGWLSGWMTGGDHALPRLADSDGALAWTLVMTTVTLLVLAALRATDLPIGADVSVVVVLGTSLVIVLGGWTTPVRLAFWAVAACGTGLTWALFELWRLDVMKDDLLRHGSTTHDDRESAARSLALRGTRILLFAALLVAAAAWIMGLRWIVDHSPPSESILLFLTLTLPLTLVATRVRGGIGNATSRKQTAILWDVGTFWPRWFHPFAPPTYSDVAVEKFAGIVRSGLPDYEYRSWGVQPGDPGSDTGLLLAPHSQGTVITFAALLLVLQETAHDDRDDTSRLANLSLLTYGTPLRSLYQPMFPGQVDDPSLQRLRTALPGRWRNLWRDSDPIGGAVGPTEDDATASQATFDHGEGTTGHGAPPEDAYWSDVDVRDDGPQTGHSSYRQAPAWADAVADLTGTGNQPPRVRRGRDRPVGR